MGNTEHDLFGLPDLVHWATPDKHLFFLQRFLFRKEHAASLCCFISSCVHAVNTKHLFFGNVPCNGVERQR